MRTKVTLVLLFLNVALFFFIFKFERNWQTEAASREARRRVLGPEAADIRMLTIASASGGSFSLVRQRDNWHLAEPIDWPANPHAVSSMLHELQLLEHETSFRVADLTQSQQSLADYGLDKPKVTVTFSSGDPSTAGARPKTVLRIGDLTKDGKRLFVLSPSQERIHIVSSALLETLSRPLDHLRADSVLTIPIFEARSLSLQATGTEQVQASGAAGVRVRIRRDGARWTFETPITARASKAAVDLSINELNALRAKSFNPPAPAALPSAAPVLRVTLEGNQRSETLFVGAPAAAPAANATHVEHYAQLADGNDVRKALFTVAMPVSLLDALRNAQERLRERRILEFDPNAVTSITLASPIADRPPLTLQRLETPAGNNSVAARWQVVRRAENDAGLETLPADAGAIKRLLERLVSLSVEKFKTDAPTNVDIEDWGFNRPQREVTLTLAGAATPIVLRLGTDAIGNVYARMGTATEPGASIYEVKFDFQRELPITPEAWRERALREALPSGARFTSLKLTDLETKRIVFETSFDAEGGPGAPPADPQALRALLDELRELRAQSFVREPFSEKGLTSIDEGAWRYQLDATVLLPGTPGLEPTSTTTLLLTKRISGTQQYAGSKELNLVFQLQQPLLDALWSLTYGPRDPGPPSVAAPADAADASKPPRAK